MAESGRRRYERNYDLIDWRPTLIARMWGVSYKIGDDTRPPCDHPVDSLATLTGTGTPCDRCGLWLLP